MRTAFTDLIAWALEVALREGYDVVELDRWGVPRFSRSDALMRRVVLALLETADGLRDGETIPAALHRCSGEFLGQAAIAYCREVRGTHGTPVTHADAWRWADIEPDGARSILRQAARVIHRAGLSD